jgi:hypothetical protein
VCTALVPFFARLGARREETTVVHNLVAASTNLVVDPIRHERKLVLKGLEMSDGNFDLLNQGLVEDRTPHFLQQVGGHQVLQNSRWHIGHRFFRKDILQHIHQLLNGEARENFKLVRHGQTRIPFLLLGAISSIFVTFTPILRCMRGDVRFLSLSPILYRCDGFSIVIANLQAFSSYRIVTTGFLTFASIFNVFRRFYKLSAAIATLATVVFVDFQSFSSIFNLFRRFSIFTTVFRTLSTITIFVPFSMVWRKIPKIDHFFQV